MDQKFICVFSEKDRDLLLRAGFMLVHEDRNNNLYQFLVNRDLPFSLNNMQYAFTNRLDF